MGCLNSEGQFAHWFGNLHFSGDCNRSCYFCIGQHMMGLDALNNLHQWPLPGFNTFVRELKKKNITEVNLTGSNTDPLLATKIEKIKTALLKHIPNLRFGLRTNGVAILSHPERWRLFDKASISITSFDKDIYQRTMGQGEPIKLEVIKSLCDAGCGPDWKDVKINTVLCPEMLEKRKDIDDEWQPNRLKEDILFTISECHRLNIRRINLREPYGQPEIGSKFAQLFNSLVDFKPREDVLGNKCWEYYGSQITLWNVHLTEVESVNLYANGVVSTTYPVTKGCDPVNGDVKGQEHFHKSGRVRPQWLTSKGNTIAPTMERLN